MRRGARILALLLSMCAPLGLGSTHAASPTAATAAPATPFDASIDLAKKSMMADPAAALRHAQKAAALAGTVRPPQSPELAAATAHWLEGEALSRLNRAAEAAPVLSKALETVARLDPNSKLHGDLMRAHGAVNAIAGRVQAALLDFQRAFAIYRASGQPRGQAMALQNIGMIYTDAGDYEKVLRYYEQAAEIYDGDPALSIANHNNLGRAYRDLGRSDRAEQEFQRALAIAHQIGSPTLEENILEDLAWTQLQAGHLDAADASIGRAMRLNAQTGGEGSRPFLWGVAAQSALKRGDLTRAEALIRRTFDSGAGDELPYREFHRTAYEIYKRMGRDDQALSHLEAFKRLDDQARTLAASTNAALMAARFDFANQNLRIAQLKAGQAERDAALATSRARFRTTVFGGALGVTAVILALVSIALVQIRRSRNETRAANASLSTANVALEKALKAKTEFLATTSHEIRTPLNGILGMTQVILADRAMEPELHERIRLVHNAGETMRALVDDLLDVAKMETGNLALTPEPTNLHDILRDTARLWGDQAAAKQVAVALDLGDTPSRVVADEARLRQVIFNLMSNAVKFTDKGSVRLAAAVEPGEKEMLLISVTDTGIGIPADKFDEIFESFRQVDGGTTRQFGGTGLGLAICEKIVRAMEGSISVDSVVGQGSTFTLHLPLVRAAPPSRTEKPGETALLIEGNPLTRSVLTALLGKAFPQVAAADSLAVALDLLSSTQFAAILLDWEGLGDDDDLMAAVRAIVTKAGGTHVTLLCPAPGPGNIPLLREAGATQVLIKPVSGQTLLRALSPLAREAEAA